MYKFSKRSLDNLSTCHPDLQRLMNEVIKHYDIAIVCGFRSKEDQDKAVKSGNSKVKWPNSKHNGVPSRAVDILPCPIPKTPEGWESLEYKRQFQDLSKIVFACAALLKIKIRWGGDFNMDGDKTRNDSWDMPHYELY